MVRGILLTFMDPKEEGCLDELDTWLNDIHIPEMLTVPGCRAVTRYTVSADQQPGMVGPRHRFLNICEIEAESIPSFLIALATYPRTPTAALNIQSMWHAVYLQLGERQRAARPPQNTPPKVRMISAVFVGPKDPRHLDDYSAWMDNLHIKEMLAVPGCVAGTRYVLSPDQPINTVGPRHPFLNLWEIEAESGAAYQRELAAHPRTPTALVDAEHIQHANYEQLGERREAGRTSSP